MPAADDRDRHRPAGAEISQLTEDELLEAIARSEEARRSGRERTGRLLAELHARGRLSWPAIARVTGIRQTTAYELAEPYFLAEQDPEQPPQSAW